MDLPYKPASKYHAVPRWIVMSDCTTPIAFPAVDTGRLWNGWACPLVHEDDMVDVVALMEKHLGFTKEAAYRDNGIFWETEIPEGRTLSRWVEVHVFDGEEEHRIPLEATYDEGMGPLIPIGDGVTWMWQEPEDVGNVTREEGALETMPHVADSSLPWVPHFWNTDDTLRDVLPYVLIKAIEDQSTHEEHPTMLDWAADSGVGFSCVRIYEAAKALDQLCADSGVIDWDGLAEQMLVFAWS